jgi:hypothetical protein
VGVFEVAHPFAKDGTVVVYFAFASPQVIQGYQNAILQVPPGAGGPPEGLTVLSLSVTIDSVQVHSGTSDETGWTDISSGTVTVDLMKQNGDTVLLGTVNIAEQNITMVRMHVASATAMIQDTPGTEPRQVKVPSDELKVPVMAEIRGQLTTSITITPHSVHIVTQTDPIIVRPVLLLKQVDGPE